MNLIPWKRVFLAVAGLLVISTVGCDPAKAQDEPEPVENPAICWDHPTENDDGSPLTDLSRFRMALIPEDGQLSYYFWFDQWGIAPDADENGRQCVYWHDNGNADEPRPGLLSRIQAEEERAETSLYGEFKVVMMSVDENGNVSENQSRDLNPSVQIRYVAVVGDRVAPSPPANLQAVPEQL
ncbi:MAG: hypothetical protein AAFN78_20995 [Pseudomonadota bacterium]